LSSAPIRKITLPCKKTIDRASHDGKQFDHERRLLMPDRSVKYVHVVARGQRDSSGNVEFNSAEMDVTAARKTERKSQCSERCLTDRSDTSILSDNPLLSGDSEMEQLVGTHVEVT
jgi:hypothetical protein